MQKINLLFLGYSSFLKRVFALPSNKNLYILLTRNNLTKRIKVKKDDCIQNFFHKILFALKSNNFEIFYKILLNYTVIREKIKNQ